MRSGAGVMRQFKSSVLSEQDCHNLKHTDASRSILNCERNVCCVFSTHSADLTDVSDIFYRFAQEHLSPEL